MELITDRDAFLRRVFEAVDEPVAGRQREVMSNFGGRPEEIVVFPGFPEPTEVQRGMGLSQVLEVWDRIGGQGAGCLVAACGIDMDPEYGGSPICALGVWVVERAQVTESTA